MTSSLVAMPNAVSPAAGPIAIGVVKRVTGFLKFPANLPPSCSNDHGFLVKPGMTEKSRINPVFFSNPSPRAIDPGSMSKG